MLGYLAAAYAMKGDREQFLKTVEQFKSLGVMSESSAYIAGAYYVLRDLTMRGARCFATRLLASVRAIYLMIAGVGAQERIHADRRAKPV